VSEFPPAGRNATCGPAGTSPRTEMVLGCSSTTSRSGFCSAAYAETIDLLAPSSGDGFEWKWALGDELAGGAFGVKGCAGCSWLFVDESKNKSRRWCAMEDCGTHAKTQRYVARRAAKWKS
jgi:hypothetical protein